MKTNKKMVKPSFLRLVVTGGSRSDQEVSEQVLVDDTLQLEMFEHPNSICFVTAKNLTLDEVKSLVRRHHFHHVVDIREVPYLNFGGSSRATFFNFLADYSVDYLSLFSVATSHNQMSVYDFLEEDNSNLHDFSCVLSDWIEHGPTLALISQERETDLIAQTFSKFLIDSKITYSEITT